MSVVLVTGGTGQLGRQVVHGLREAGHTARVMSRRGGPDRVVADLVTGSGLAAALKGVDVVVHAASDPTADPRSVDVDGTGRLLRACREEGIAHFLYVSIVGVDRNPFPYYRAKLDAEQIVTRAGLPFSIVRATQFPTLITMMLGKMRRGPICLVPWGFAAEPVAVEDVAAFLLERVEAGPSRQIDDFAGPERLTAARLARQWLRARGRHALVVPVWLPGAAARAFRRDSNIAGSEARRGAMKFAEWLGSHPDPTPSGAGRKR